MLITAEDDDDRHFINNHQNDDVRGDDQKISINVKVKDRLKKAGSLFKLRHSSSTISDVGGGGSGGLILPISATIVMRSDSGVSHPQYRKKTIRESSSGFRVRRRIGKTGFVPAVSVVFALFLFLFVVFSVNAPSPVRRHLRFRPYSTSLSLLLPILIFRFRCRADWTYGEREVGFKSGGD